MEYIKIISIGAAIILFIVIVLGIAESYIRDFINEVIPLKREITKTEAYAITVIIFLLIAA
ncbi:MAG: hypothetical protein WC682_03000 [Parcubacteria group bacterium]|jgi:hypothetical protein